MKKILMISVMMAACFSAVFAGAGKLAIGSVDISPNPFSPHKGAGVTNISYTIDTESGASNIKATLVIYNLAGKEIRTLVGGLLRSAVSLNNDAWDGRDSKGKLCQNGRYILKIEVEDFKGKKQNLFSIVLAK